MVNAAVQTDTRDDLDVLSDIRQRLAPTLDGMAPADRLAYVRAGCRLVIEQHRVWRGRGLDVVDGAGWSQPAPRPDPGTDGAVVAIRDILHANVSSAVDDGRDALVRAEHAIEAGDLARARRAVELADTELGQIRELTEQVDGLLARAQGERARLSYALAEARMQPMVIDDTRRLGPWSPERGRAVRIAALATGQPAQQMVLVGKGA